MPKPVATVRPVATTTPRLKSSAPLYGRTVLPGGATLVTRLDRSAPRVAISLLVRAGAVDETPDEAGWRRLLTEAMLRASLPEGGTGAVTGLQMQKLAEEAGGRIGATVSDDVIEFWATGDSRNASTLLDLLLSVVQHPRLSDADVRAARSRTVERIAGERDDVAVMATAALRGQLYRDTRGDLIAYGLPSTGTTESLGNLNRERLLELYRRYFVPSRFTVAGAGDVNVTALRTRLERLPAVVETPVPPLQPSLFALPAKTDPALIVRQVPTRDAWVFISYRVAPSTSADAPALRVLAAALGEEPNARLQRRVSAQNNRLGFGGVTGPGAVAAASITPRRYGGELVMFAQTSASNVDAAKDALLDEVRKLRETSLSATELLRAKNFARGSWAVDREGLRERAFQAGLAAAVNPVPALARGTASMAVANDWDWPAQIAAVTAADVRRVAQKYLNAYAVALIMPED
jgi:predicted Zn-dependent peptidase